MEENVIDIWHTAFSKSYIKTCGGLLKNKNITSPIEQILYLVLIHLDLIIGMTDTSHDNFKIYPQKKIGKYRVDFHIVGNKNELIVECDSQEWHERSEKQRRYEKERDRFIQSKGFTVFHYTGKEIMENIWLPPSEIINFVSHSDQKERVEYLKSFYGECNDDS